MSRGLGRIEQFIVEILDYELALGVASGPEIARTITGGADAPAVRRALKRLEAKGIIVPLPKREGRAILWVLTGTAKAEAKRQRRREGARTRRAGQKRKGRQKSDDARMAGQRLRDRKRETIRREQLLGMLGSAHEGEILNAARLVEKERHRMGKTWAEILAREDSLWLDDI